MKVKIQDLLSSEKVLADARLRGNIPTNYAVERNFKRVTEALKPFRDAQKEEPLCWFFWEQIHPPKSKGKKKDKKKKDEPELKPPTDAQAKDGQVALGEYLLEEVEFSPYKLDIDRCSEKLGKLSNAREKLSDEVLGELNENFTAILMLLGIIDDGGE